MSSSATPGGGVVSIALLPQNPANVRLFLFIPTRETKVFRNGSVHPVNDVQLYINKPGEETEA